MNAQLTIFLALISAFLWGLGPVLYKQFYNHCSAYTGYVLDALFGSALVLLPFALIGQPVYEHLLSAILLTAPYSLSYLLFLMAFEFGEVALVSVVAQTYPIFTMLMAFTLGNEPIAPLQLGLMLIIISTSMTIALAGDGFKFKLSKPKPWLVLAALSAILLGIGDFFLDETVALYDVHTMTLAIFLSQLLISAVVVLVLHKQMFAECKLLKERPVLLWSGLIASLAMSFGAIAFYQAFEYGSAVLVSSVSSVEPVFAIGLACIFLKEELNSVQLFLMGITLSALILLAL